MRYLKIFFLFVFLFSQTLHCDMVCFERNIMQIDNILEAFRIFIFA